MKLRYPLAVLVLVMWSVVSNNDFENELQQESIYIEGVCDGVHGDYLDLKPSCQPT